ncbi:hypothetical protein COX86_01940 [Candidatus Micrarchaeota archaeon CG_4_10_14_0_2_um_filter_60_11]|nr:MAG: hypothetical protein AUJ16_04585 [Candidatus Micrarchaeota archaeon CG1_02_60_51]PIN96377.1 MAG: hypothetical protein COU39_01355 [Candidatus Micrarchaeota archaeon CG10_big_fil_rev_8_21_14_0_10_60_32]PIO02051.1 MAG: hypothetical protein COT58_01985 [Candidatus Micrarchaeota archaeon CG09_land_8_20_14_0_10_60_16]PIY91230.1 MAG: hypothetical protein COY71_04255 [Candidatus Micrarchaeota archaeon CG_4_10_14_0_8_um_filter_60_7]PIZ90989.1 MAG: hypothetical protein COX86_01940 [Candidatus Mi
MIAEALAAAYAAAASYSDARSASIPNELTLTFALAAVAFAFFSGVDLFAFAAFGALWLCFAYLLYSAGVWGAGDAKFFACLSLYLALIKGVSVQTGALWFLASAALAIAFYCALRWKPLLAVARKEWRAWLEATATKALSSAGFASLLLFAGVRFDLLWLVALVVVLRFLDLPLLLCVALAAVGVALNPSQALAWFASSFVLFVAFELLFAVKRLAKALKRRPNNALEAGMVFAPFLSIGFVLAVFV